MPWCPQCGAEYRAGYTRCAKCGVVLQADRPDLPQAKRQTTIPSFLQRPWRDVKRAWGYGAEAARVLRRCPALLLIPIALVFVDVAETSVGRYVSISWTVRRFDTTWHFWPQPDGGMPWRTWQDRLVIAGHKAFDVRRAGTSFAQPLPDVPLEGTRQALISSSGDGPSLFRTVVLTLLFAAPGLVTWPLAAIIASGYYPLAASCARGAGFCWERFSSDVRRFLLRFLGFSGLVIAASIVTIMPFVLWPGVLLTDIGGKAVPLGRAVVVTMALVTFGLTQVSIVSDDRKVFSAMRASARTVIGDLGVTVAALAALFALGGFLVYPLHLLRVLIVDVYSIVAFAESTALSLGIGMIEAFIGTWFLLVSFLWYGQASSDIQPVPAS